MSLFFPLGTVLVRGPKASDFYDAFCAQRATLLKADGKDVVDVKCIPKKDDKEDEVDVESNPDPDPNRAG